MKKKSTELSRKVLASALSAAMVVAFAPAVAMADGATTGDGSAAVQSNEATVVTLTASDVQDGQIVISTSAFYKLGENITADIVVSAGVEADIDLGGFTLTNASNGKATLNVQGAATVHDGSVIGGTSYYNIEVPKGGDLILAGITATAGNTGASMIDNYGTLRIESGTYTGGLNVVKNEPNASVEISDGSFELSFAASGYTGVVLNYGKLDINGGVFTQTSTGRWSTQQVVCNMVSDSEPSANLCANIASGTYINKSAGTNARVLWYYGKAPATSFNVTGGKFNKAPSEYVLKDGYPATKGSDGYYVVTKTPCLKLSETKLSINEHAQPVQLTASVKPDEEKQEEVSWASSDPTIATVDQNGIVTPVTKGQVTITATTASYESTCSVSVTRDTAKIGDTVYQSLADAVKAAGSNAVTEIDLIADTSETVTFGSKKVTLHLNGYSVTGTNTKYGAFYMGSSGVATIVGPGTVSNPKSGLAISGGGTWHLQGGIYAGEISKTFKDGSDVTGGVFASDPTAYVDAEKYDVHQADGKYVVHAKDAGETKLGAIEATCTAAGSTDTGYCKGCYDLGVSYVTAEPTVIPATGHSPVAVSGVAASCMGSGLTSGSACSVCGTVLTGQETIPALGHSYTWVTTTPATEDAEGVSTGTCSRCGATTTTSIPKLPKSGSDETVVDTNTGAKVDVTVVDNAVTTLPDGSSAAGAVSFSGVSSAADADTAVTEFSVPETVTLGNGSTYVVTKIEDEAFAGETQLTKVAIPSTVVEIGASAFAGTSIASVDLPAGVTTIGEGAFEGTKLEAVSLPETVTTVAPSTFKDCTSLTTVSAPAAETIGASALSGCTSLTAVEAPAVKEIGASALKDCTSLTTVDAPAAETVAASAFSGCTSLKAVELPAATAIGAKAFQGCAALKSVDVASAVTIGAKAFSGASRLKTVTTGNKLSSIGAKALKGTKVTKLKVSSKKLTASSVAGSLRGSSVKKVVVAVSGSKKTVGKYVAKYAKAFKKANSGKAVKVVAGR